MRLLLIEDNLALANGLIHSLAQSSHITDAAHTANEALIACATATYQLVILDLGLPDMDGIDLLRRLRQRGLTAPVLILTARDTLQDRVQGLDSGADDYLQKPFDLSELEARIRALSRRGTVSDSTVRFGDMSFDTVSRQVTCNAGQLDLTARELGALEILMQRPGRIVSKQQLLEAVYENAVDINLTVIEVLISRLRRKLDESAAGVNIRALRGLGYRLESAHAK